MASCSMDRLALLAVVVYRVVSAGLVGALAMAGLLLLLLFVLLFLVCLLSLLLFRHLRSYFLDLLIRLLLPLLACLLPWMTDMPLFLCLTSRPRVDGRLPWVSDLSTTAQVRLLSVLIMVLFFPRIAFILMSSELCCLL